MSAMSASASVRTWRRNNPEKARAMQAAWRKRNPEKHKASGQKYYAKNKEKVKASARRWRERNAELARARAKQKHLIKAYGLTIDAFFALLRGQNDCCAICRGAEKDWVVDHDHKTGAVRGVLCRQCNLGLGGFNDSPDSLLNAAAYLMAR